MPPVFKNTVGRFLKPSATITPLPTPGTARLAVKWAVVALTLVGSVEDGRLVLAAEGRTERAARTRSTHGVDGWVGNAQRLAGARTVTAWPRSRWPRDASRCARSGHQ